MTEAGQAATGGHERALQRPRRGRRRRRAAGMLLVAGVLWLAGRGLGWFGSGGVDEAMPPVGETALARLPDGGESSGSPAGSPTAAPTAGAAAAPGSGSSGSVAPVPAAEAAPTEVATLASDRFGATLRLVERMLRAHEFASADEVLGRLRSQPLSGAQQLAVERRCVELVERREAVERSLLEHLRRGEVLQADALAGELGGGGSWRPEVLGAAVPWLALGDDWLRAPVETHEVSPVAPLRRGMSVRVREGERLVVGRVASVRGAHVTVQVKGTEGQRFPTVAVVAVEPVATDASCAAEMGLLALDAGAYRLARLWLVRAALQADGVLPPAAAVLQAALR